MVSHRCEGSWVLIDMLQDGMEGFFGEGVGSENRAFREAGGLLDVLNAQAEAKIRWNALRYLKRSTNQLIKALKRG